MTPIGFNRKAKDILTDQTFVELMQKHFNQNLHYIFALVIDVKQQSSFYNGCEFAKMRSMIKGEYNPQTAEKIDKIYYYAIDNDQLQPNDNNYLGSEDDLVNPPIYSYIFSQDISLECSARAEYQFQMGQYLFSGQGITQDYTNALAYYQKAGIEGKHPQALYMIGYCLENGLGIELHKSKAMEWYYAAAQHSNDNHLIIDVANKLEKESQIDKALFLYKKVAQSVVNNSDSSNKQNKQQMTSTLSNLSDTSLNLSVTEHCSPNINSYSK